MSEYYEHMFERAKAAEREVAALRAEVERLTKEMDGQQDDFNAELERLCYTATAAIRARVQKLEGALREVISDKHGYYDTKRLVRAALESRTGPIDPAPKTFTAVEIDAALAATHRLPPVGQYEFESAFRHILGLDGGGQ